MSYLGNAKSSWEHTYAALRRSSQLGDPRRLHAIYAISGDALLAAGRVSAAYVFRNETVRVAKLSKQPVGIAHALVQRSIVLARLGRAKQAATDLFSARLAVQQIKDDALRERVEADLCISEAEVAAASNTSGAINYLTNAIDFYGGKESRYPLGALYLARGRLRIKLGDEAGAESDLRAGIEDFELQRRSIGEESFQISFFERSQGLFEEMLYLQAVHRQLAKESFDWAERARARALLDRLALLLPREKRILLAKESGESVTLEEVQRQLPSGVVLISFSVLTDRLLTWVVRADESVSLIAQPISRTHLRGLIGHLRRAIGGKTNETYLDVSSSLYDILIRPYVSRIGQGTIIIFVPDKELHSIPFAALYDRISRQYLVQRHVTLIAPSASFCVRAMENYRWPAHAGSLRAFIIGNPRFKQDLGSGLLMLPWAEREAVRIGGMLPSQLVLGEQATSSRLVSEANQYDIVHFAGHAIVNTEYPLLSYLLLAPGKGSTGVLYSHDIYELKFDRTSLVVLAACNTASGQISSEGTLSIARAFIGAGVPQVIASLWRVDDRAGATFFETFYERLLFHGDPVKALQDAQLTLLASTNPAYRRPESWAGFQMVSGFKPPS
jgi:CHAT domain-containing protein